MIGVEIVTFFLIVGAVTYVGTKSATFYRKKKAKWVRNKEMNKLKQEVVVTEEEMYYAPLIVPQEPGVTPISHVVYDGNPPMINCDGSTTVTSTMRPDRIQQRASSDDCQQESIPVKNRLSLKNWKKKRSEYISYQKLEEDSKEVD